MVFPFASTENSGSEDRLRLACFQERRSEDLLSWLMDRRTSYRGISEVTKSISGSDSKNAHAPGIGSGNRASCHIR